MTAENNRKYTAEAWIENGEEENLKTSFLNSLIEQNQHHLNGFDADTVDEMHWNDIQEYIDNKTINCLTSFQIGLTIFSVAREVEKYFLGFDAIKLYDFDSDGYSDEQKKLPWTNVINEREKVPNLLEVINQLYKKTAITEESGLDVPSDATNNTLYKAFIDRISALESKIGDKVLEIEQNGETVRLLNADSVNGLRFFVYSDEKYADLESLASQYVDGEDNPTDVDEAYTFLSSPHNVFIVRPEAELEAAGGAYDNNPDTISFKYGYQFRVCPSSDCDERQGETPKLQYKHEMETGWKDICDAADFIDENKVAELVVDTISYNTTYTLNSDSFGRSIVPFQNQNKATYLVGGVYNCNSTTETMCDLEVLNIEGRGDYRYLNLIPLQNKITTDLTNDLNNYKVRLEGANRNGGLLGQMSSNISSNSSRVSSLETRINTLEAELRTSKNQLQNAITCLEELYNWRQVAYWHGLETHKGNTSYDAYANKDFVTFTIYGNFENVPTTWTEYGEHPIVENNYYWPSKPHSFIDYELKVVFRVRDNTGKLEYKSNTGNKISSTEVYVNTVWKARGGTQKTIDL